MTDHSRMPDDYFNAIGRVATSWAGLELIINVMLWDLMNVEKAAGDCITSQIFSPTGRSKALVSLIRLRGGQQALVTAANKFTARYIGLGERRNRYVHDAWLHNRATNDIAKLQITADRELVYKEEPTKVSELLALEADINKASDDLATLYKSLVAELPSWPRTQFAQSPGISLAPR
jgi:hypothetical protein